MAVVARCQRPSLWRSVCPLVVDPMPDDIDAVQRKHRNEQMALDPLAQLVPDRAQPEFGLVRNVASISVRRQ